MKAPITYPDHVVITATIIKQITPGTMPRAFKADGMARIPRPIWVFIMRATVPKKPT